MALFVAAILDLLAGDNDASLSEEHLVRSLNEACQQRVV
jgi:hypothetical protein